MKSQHHSQRHAAFVFKGGAVMSFSTNSYRYHAEVNALRVLDIDDWVLLSVRVGKAGRLKNAKPCEACRNYMIKRGVKVVLYSTEEGKIKREKL